MLLVNGSVRLPTLQRQSFLVPGWRYRWYLMKVFLMAQIETQIRKVQLHKHILNLCYITSTNTAFSKANHMAKPKNEVKRRILCSCKTNCNITWQMLEQILGEKELKVIIQSIRWGIGTINKFTFYLMCSSLSPAWRIKI